MKKPLVTFVCPSYNHAKYVDDFINSVLAQTISNWELIIVDDHSTDNNIEHIEKYTDDRIVFIKNNYNKGMAYGLNRGIVDAKADIISFVASDDILFSTYAEEMLKEFEDEDISAVYCHLQYIDDDGKVLLSKVELPVDNTTEEIYANLFVEKNQLPSPGMMFRKSAIKKYLPLNLGMIQYTDFQLHMFLLFEGKCKLKDKTLAYYRRSEGSASKISSAVVVREEIEMDTLMNTVCNQIGANVEVFNKFFANYKVLNENKITPETTKFWLGRLALTSSMPEKQKWGLKTIMNYISCSENMALLNKLYGFSYKDFMRLGALSCTDKRLKKLKKYKKLSNILLVVTFVLLVINLLQVFNVF